MDAGYLRASTTIAAEHAFSTWRAALRHPVLMCLCGHAQAQCLCPSLQLHGHVPQDIMDAVLQDIGLQMRTIAEREGLAAPAPALLPAFHRMQSTARMQAQAQAQGSAFLPLPSVSEVDAVAPTDSAEEEEGGGGGAGMLGPSLTHGSGAASGDSAGGAAAGLLPPLPLHAAPATIPAAAGETAAGAVSMQRLLEEFSRRRSGDGE